MINQSTTPQFDRFEINLRGGKLAINLDPDVKEFAITTEPKMPEIQVKVSLIDVGPGAPVATAMTMFEWTATLEYKPTDCKNGIGAAYEPLKASGISPGGWFTVQFNELRAGKLSISVKARAPTGVVIMGERKDLKIVATNPRYKELTEALPSKVMRALTWHESRGRQFLANADGGTGGCPLYSGDKLGGVGLMQLTRPAPTREQTWNWRANIAGGLALFETKKQTARAFPATYRQSTDFRTLVAAYNAERAKKKLAALIITIPDFTEEQVELDALRGYNGWAAGLHEYRAARDATGKLIVDVAADGRSGAARWEQVTAAVRTAVYDAVGIPAANRGDPDYVRHIMDANVPY